MSPASSSMTDIVVVEADGWPNGLPKREVEDHPLACNPQQHWACEQPENPDLQGVLFYMGCEKCRIVLTVGLVLQPGAIMMLHGQSFKDRHPKVLRRG